MVGLKLNHVSKRGPWRPGKQPDASNEKWKMVVKLALYVISGYGNQVMNGTMHRAI